MRRSYKSAGYSFGETVATNNETGYSCESTHLLVLRSRLPILAVSSIARTTGWDLALIVMLAILTEARRSRILIRLAIARSRCCCRRCSIVGLVADWSVEWRLRDCRPSRAVLPGLTVPRILEKSQ